MAFYKSVLRSVACLLLAGCGSAPKLANGDLVFVEASEGPMSSAISQATGLYDHVGIVSVDARGEVTVIEATPRHGVVERGWDDFVSDNERWVVMTLEGCERDDAVKRARSYLGVPYDWSYEPGDQALYCSELVQLCCLDRQGQPIFASSPMNFYAADGTLPQYWRDLFGDSVPQGVPGTNPTEMSKNKSLKIKDI